jgi:polar amino acid transport system substrate-binding protein
MLTLLSGAMLALGAIPAAAQPAQGAKPDPKAAAAEFAPTGKLRAAINLGNGVLAQKDPKTGELDGVSVRLAKALAAELHLPIELIPYPSAGQTTDAAANGAWDVAFLAVDPGRAQNIIFTTPYVEIVGTYMVKADSPIRSTEDVDRDGVKVSVGRGAAYDLYLSRQFKHAQFDRAPTSGDAIQLFLDGKVDAVAGVRAALTAAAQAAAKGGRSDLRIIDPGFQTIEQAVAVPKGRESAYAYAQAFVERMKASGFVRKALDETHQTDAGVAPPAK